MSRTFQLEVVTAERTFFSGEAVSVVLPALDGLHGIMAGHSPMVTAVENGVLKYRTPDDVWHFAAVGRGFAEVMPDRTVILVTTAERPSEIDGTVGTTVEMGEKQGLSLPLSRRLVEMVHEIEAGKREICTENLLELQAEYKRLYPDGLEELRSRV